MNVRGDWSRRGRGLFRMATVFTLILLSVSFVQTVGAIDPKEVQGLHRLPDGADGEIRFSPSANPSTPVRFPFDRNRAGPPDRWMVLRWPVDALLPRTLVFCQAFEAKMAHRILVETLFNTLWACWRPEVGLQPEGQSASSIPPIPARPSRPAVPPLPLIPRQPACPPSPLPNPGSAQSQS